MNFGDQKWSAGPLLVRTPFAMTGHIALLLPLTWGWYHEWLTEKPPVRRLQCLWSPGPIVLCGIVITKLKQLITYKGL